MIVNDDNLDAECGVCHLDFGVALGVKEPTSTPPPVHDKKKEPVKEEVVEEPKKKEFPVHHEVKHEDPEKDFQKKAGRPKKDETDKR